MRTQPLNNKIEMSEIWIPITVGNLVEEFKKIKADTAAGTDRIKKLHLRKKSTARICEIV